MAGFVQWITVLLSVCAVLNAEPFEENTADLVELATDEKDAFDSSDEPAFQGKVKGRGEWISKISTSQNQFFWLAQI